MTNPRWLNGTRINLINRKKNNEMEKRWRTKDEVVKFLSTQKKEEIFSNKTSIFRWGEKTRSTNTWHYKLHAFVHLSDCLFVDELEKKKKIEINKQ